MHELSVYANNVAIVNSSGEKICNAAPLRAMQIVQCGDGKPVFRKTKIRSVIWLRKHCFAQAVSAKADIERVERAERENTDKSSGRNRPTKYVYNYDSDTNVQGVWAFYRIF